MERGKNELKGICLVYIGWETKKKKELKHKLKKEKSTKRWIHERESIEIERGERNFGMVGKA